MNELKRLINRAISLILQGQSQGAETVLEQAIEEIDRVSSTVKAMDDKVVYLPEVELVFDERDIPHTFYDDEKVKAYIESQGYRVEVKGGS